MSPLKQRLARGLCFRHPHVLTNLCLVPIAKLTHPPHGFGHSALHLMGLTAAGAVHFSLFSPVLAWGSVCVCSRGSVVLLTDKYGGRDGSPGMTRIFAALLPRDGFKRMGPTKQWLSLADMWHRTFLFLKPWHFWRCVRWPASHLCSIFVYMCVLSSGCWCCLVILFYLSREALTFLVRFLNIFN